MKSSEGIRCVRAGVTASGTRCVLCVGDGKMRKKYGFVVEVEQHIIMN